jgi:hypothetical protein
MDHLLLLLVIVLLIAEMKLARPDGALIGDLHPYRRLMQFVMPSRTESIVYMETKVRAERLEAYLVRARESFGGNVTHAAVAAVAIGLAQTPPLNRFVSGRRVYQRHGRWVTFAAKRTKGNAGSALSEVKVRIREGETFAQLCQRLNDRIHTERSGVQTDADQQFELFNSLPRFALRPLQALLRRLDYYNLLPGQFIVDDGMYTSCFLANLGSLGMEAAYHHLYEWGNCPLFMMVGATKDEPVVEDGELTVGRVMTVRWSYDERIADGLTARHGIDDVVKVLEDPFRWLGCLDEDGADAVTLQGGSPVHALTDDPVTSSTTIEEEFDW